MSQSETLKKRNAEVQASACLVNPKDVLARLQELYDAGHPDRDGIERAMADWIMQDLKDSVDRMETE